MQPQKRVAGLQTKALISVVLALASFASGVSAAPKLSPAQGDVVAGVYKLLGAAYICRNVLGVQPYGDAKSFGERIQIEAGIPASQARLNVRNLDSAVRVEVSLTGRGPGKCRNAIAELKKTLRADALRAKR